MRTFLQFLIMKKQRNLLHCGKTKIPKSLTDWADIISCKMGFMEIIKLLDRVFNEGLIDRSDQESVHILDEDAYSLINSQLILTGASIEDIANALQERGLNDLFNNLINLIVKSKHSPDVMEEVIAELKARVEETMQ